MEIFNELILTTMIAMTLCFTENMTPEGQQTIGLYFIGILVLFLLVHLCSLLSDTVVKVCRLIWLQFAKCQCGKAL